MGHIGDLGIEKEPVVDTFGYFGATIRTNPDLTDIAALEAFESVHKAQDRVSVLEALRGVMSTLIHPDDVDLCWTLARQHRQGIEEIGALAAQLLEVATDRPFSQPAGSSDGPSTTATSSADVSDSPALHVLEGRPDLQVAVIRAKKAG